MKPIKTVVKPAEHKEEKDTKQKYKNKANKKCKGYTKR